MAKKSLEKLTRSKNKKTYYQELILQHKKTLAKARELIEQILDRLSDDVDNFEPINYDEISQDSKNSFLFGKDSASTIITRLTTILLKLIPLEQEIAKTDLSKADLEELEEITKKTHLPEEDINIIERYLEKHNNINEID